MALPAYWWLLALAVAGQGLFFLLAGVLRMRGKGVQPLARRARFVLLATGGAGLAYGLVQRDPVFVVGQAACLLLYYHLYKEQNDQREK